MDNKLFIVLLRCKSLTDEELRKLFLFFTHNWTYEECGLRLGLSKQAVEQSISRGIKKLKKFYKTPDIYRMKVEV
jgi:predicted DNA-binding protein (UPF0251 family)